MKEAFFSTLTEVARRDSRVVFITGDVGMGFAKQLSSEIGPRFINAGVAEQNMMAMAAGLAQEGFRVFVYSIANFPVFRCLEQFRNLVAYPGASVVVVSVGAGMGYGAQGFTHHSLEDIAVMSALPKVKVLVPGSDLEVAGCVEGLAKLEGPAYLRLERASVVDFSPTIPFKFGSPRSLKEGEDATVIALGGMVPIALEASERLEKKGISVGVFSAHHVHPVSQNFVDYMRALKGPFITLEEHRSVGGFGALVSQRFACEGIPLTGFRPLAVDSYSDELGSQAHLRTHFGLTSEAVCQAILDLRKNR